MNKIILYYVTTAITESVNSKESTADNNTPSTHADIQTPLTTNDNLSSLTKHSDIAFMIVESKFFALKGYKFQR